MNPIKLAALAALIGLGVSQAHAGITNVVQDLDFQFVGVEAGGAATNHNEVRIGFTPVELGTRDVVSALGASTGNSFSRRARLVAVTPLGGSGISSIQVRDGSTTVDVTSFFSHQEVAGPISGSVSNSVHARTLDVTYSVQQIALQDDSGYSPLGLHFNISGFATESLSSTSPVAATQLTIQGSGSGDLGGTPLILQGAATVSGGTLEVVTVVGL